jgi:hypothetical protein
MFSNSFHENNAMHDMGRKQIQLCRTLLNFSLNSIGLGKVAKYDLEWNNHKDLLLKKRERRQTGQSTCPGI